MDYKDILLTLSVILNVFVLIFLENIKKRHLLDVEKLKSELQKTLIVQNLKIDAIKNFYSEFSRFRNSVRNIYGQFNDVKLHHERDEYLEKFYIELERFKIFYSPLEILFDTNLANKIDRLLILYFIYFRSVGEGKKWDLVYQYIKSEDVLMWLKRENEFEMERFESIMKLENELKNDLKEILGT